MDASKSFYRYRPTAHLVATDEDAATFLQSQFTNELRPFEAGRCSYGLWLDAKGKVIADSVVLCEGAEQFRILSERCEGERLLAQMERHIIADAVVIEPRAAGFGFELSASAVEALAWTLPALGRFVSIEGGILFSIRKDLYHLVVDLESEAERYHAQLLSAGFVALSEPARGLLRIAAGIPQVPEEIGATDLPGEGGFERDAVSFTKGCYLGQEVVARMHNIGKPQRGLFVMQGEGAVPETPQALYNSDSKQVGELRTAYSLAENWRGVALLKTRFASIGERLKCEGSEAIVIKPLREGPEND